jgi:hypothetical protein
MIDVDKAPRIIGELQRVAGREGVTDLKVGEREQISWGLVNVIL